MNDNQMTTFDGKESQLGKKTDIQIIFTFILNS